MTAPKTASIDLAVDNWWDNDDWKDYDGTVNLSFGNMNNAKKLAIGASAESNVERLTIPAPATQEYTVTFEVELYTGSVKAYSGSKEVKIEGVALEMGKAYDFHATLNADNLADNPIKPIEFNVTAVKDWDNVANNDLTTILNGVTVGQGETLNLVADAVVEGTLTVDNGIVDGAGHTLSAAETLTSNRLIKPVGDVTVKNLTIDGGNKKYNNTTNGKQEGVRGIYVTSAGTYNINIDNVTIKNVTYSINIQGTKNATLNVSNSTFSGWVSYNSSTTANFNNVLFAVNTEVDNTFRPYGKTILTNCNFAEGYTIDLGSLTKQITFINCFCNGTLITADNYDSLLTNTAGKTVLFE